ncbi:hypothetical protein [Reinekea marinisedimentorum]|uniref:Uncharacterized protein n=1 Tax=Reinekea marinisedimentorum TaxID=230495 RepID=A0A4R3IE86_9GAMM|nr:hypothetical protein [Reinekea marinisedimentorum]TCS43101.1 hypothetical protein BCF53_102125 [Reinekea marinisedimentorum]
METPNATDTSLQTSNRSPYLFEYFLSYTGTVLLEIFKALAVLAVLALIYLTMFEYEFSFFELSTHEYAFLFFLANALIRWYKRGKQSGLDLIQLNRRLYHLIALYGAAIGSLLLIAVGSMLEDSDLRTYAPSPSDKLFDQAVLFGLVAMIFIYTPLPPRSASKENKTDTSNQPSIS